MGTRRKPTASLYHRTKLRAEVALGVLDRLQIVPFRGFGNGKTFVLEGRLLESKGIAQPSGDSGLLENVADTIRRFDSDEIPDARIRATFRGRKYETYTDREGYFAFTFDDARASRPGWHKARLELLESIVGQAGVTASGSMLLPSPRAEFGIISDLDDTVIMTGAFDKTTMVRVLLSHNARTRTAFPGVSQLYRELERGLDGVGRNPFFYVSRSGWNLYDLFETFLESHDLPRGPLLLQDLRFIEKASDTISSRNDKIHRIEQILETFPRLPFVLIGDSGQQDPETYDAIVRKHRTRIRAVYLRDVTKGKRDRDVLSIVRRIERRGIPALATEDTLAVAVHAANARLIRTSALERIRAARDAAVMGKKSYVFR